MEKQGTWCWWKRSCGHIWWEISSMYYAGPCCWRRASWYPCDYSQSPAGWTRSSHCSPAWFCASPRSALLGLPAAPVLYLLWYVLVDIDLRCSICTITRLCMLLWKKHGSSIIALTSIDLETRFFRAWFHFCANLAKVLLRWLHVMLMKLMSHFILLKRFQEMKWRWVYPHESDRMGLAF